MSSYTIKQVAEMFGLTESGAYQRVVRGIIKGVRKKGDKRGTYIVPKASIDEYNERLNRRSQAWEICSDLKDDGYTYDFIGRLVRPSSNYPYQAGFEAVKKGIISDVDGFFKRLEEEGL